MGLLATKKEEKPKVKYCYAVYGKFPDLKVVKGIKKGMDSAEPMYNIIQEADNSNFLMTVHSCFVFDTYEEAMNRALWLIQDKLYNTLKELGLEKEEE